MNRAVFGGALALASSVAGCMHKPAPPPPQTPAQFTVGNPYQTGGEWRYPRIFNDYDVTGLAALYQPDRAGPTSDGETYDPQALAAASSVLQLPAIVTVTNLVNGYSMDVRVNDRGPDNPGRILAVTPRVATLLGFPPGGVVEVEVALKPQQTAALDSALGQGPKLSAAPEPGIETQTLAPPGALPGNSPNLGAAQALTPTLTAAPDAGEVSLSGRVTAFPPSPGPLFVQVPGFGRERDARAAALQLYGFATQIVPVFDGNRTLYAINVGPYRSVETADAALAQILARGVADPEIIVR